MVIIPFQFAEKVSETRCQLFENADIYNHAWGFQPCGRNPPDIAAAKVPGRSRAECRMTFPLLVHPGRTLRNPLTTPPMRRIGSECRVRCVWPTKNADSIVGTGNCNSIRLQFNIQVYLSIQSDMGNPYFPVVGPSPVVFS